MDDWGEPGPIFGPFPYFHATYGNTIKFDDTDGHMLKIGGDLVYYDGMFYGDWSVFDGPPSEEDERRLTTFDPVRAIVPEKYNPCSCMEPGHFNCGVPGVIAHLENGRLPPNGKVERCGRYPDDEAALQKLVESSGEFSSKSCGTRCLSMRHHVTTLEIQKGAFATPIEGPRRPSPVRTFPTGCAGYADKTDLRRRDL